MDVEDTTDGVRATQAPQFSLTQSQSAQMIDFGPSQTWQKFQSNLIMPTASQVPTPTYVLLEF
jgi:hypothetical protein